jgi:cell division protein FtsI/penicillin-binding protein 2
VLATPLQLAVMMAAVGTGQVVSPYVIQRVNGQEIPTKPPVALDLPDDVRRLLVQALTKVVEDSRGTGKRARVPGIKVAGKTGTAQNPHGKDHAVFAAFAPAGKPEVAIAIVIENVGHGGEFAAPIAGRILQSYFGVAPPAAIPATTGADPVVAD